MIAYSIILQNNTYRIASAITINNSTIHALLSCIPNEKREVLNYEVHISLLLSGDSIFILKSLTTSKMRKCQTIKLSYLVAQSKKLLD
jgi:hypothetical protein